MLSRSQVAQLMGDANVKAMQHVIRAGETDQTPRAYYRVNGKPDMASLDRHPYYGVTTTLGGRASGAYQHLGTTWQRIAERYPDDCKDFSAYAQDFASVVGMNDRGALQSVLDGDLAGAIEKLKDEWISLKGLGQKAFDVFKQYGGAPISAYTPPAVAAQPEVPKMGAALALLTAFGPQLLAMIPQIKPLLAPQSEVAKRNTGLAEIVLNTIVGTAKAVNLQDAVEKMQTDADVKKQVQDAIVTHPEILPFMEVGGGAAGARTFDVEQQKQEKPFWQTSAVFWISVLLMPLVFWLVGSLIVGGMAEKLLAYVGEGKTEMVPQWVVLVLSLFGSDWTGEARSGGFNLVVGLVLGGICGVYYGISVTQQKQQAGAAQPPPQG